MTVTPVVRYQNFYLKNLKALLEIYPDLSYKIGRTDANNLIEEKLGGYKRTAYQFACQLGLEDRSVDYLRLQDYIFSFADENLEKYLNFWFKVYYAPNPYVNSEDNPVMVFKEIAEEILKSPKKQIVYIEVFNSLFGGKSDDILLNAFKLHGDPIKHRTISNVDYLYVDENDVGGLELLVKRISDLFPVVDALDKGTFFNRFSYKNYCLFYGIDNGSVEIEKLNDESDKDSWTVKEDGTIAYKKVDKSIFEYGTHVPKRLADRFFNDDNKLEIGEKRSIKLRIEKRDYDANFSRYKRNDSGGFNYHLRYDSNIDLKALLKERFKASFEGEINDGINIKQYIVFKKTENPDVYELELMVNQQLKESGLRMDFDKYVQIIQSGLKTLGLTYNNSIVSSVMLSMKTKPFTLLAGLSGSGKTRFVRELSRISGASVDNGRFLLVPVRPDWTDASDVLGYVDLKGEFKATKLTDFILKANLNIDMPHFICFDEMNLARVEHYFSDFLSVIETRELRENGHIESDGLFLNQNMDESNPYRTIRISDNIYIFGTVNMDETTYPFSSKVLDRANTIEFNDINLMAVFENDCSDEVFFQDLHNDVLKGEFSSLSDVIKSLGEEAKKVVQSLEDLNAVLNTVGIGFGYRVRDEVLLYVAYALKYELLEYNEALDFCIVQKVLPKVKGSDSSLRKVLRDLFQYCLSFEQLKWKDDKLNDYQVMNEYLDKGDCSYPHSAKKLVKLMKSLEVDGYASYW